MKVSWQEPITVTDKDKSWSDFSAPFAKFLPTVGQVFGEETIESILKRCCVEGIDNLLQLDPADPQEAGIICAIVRKFSSESIAQHLRITIGMAEKDVHDWLPVLTEFANCCPATTPDKGIKT